MRYHFFLHYGWFLQNFEKDFIPTLLHTTVNSIKISRFYFEINADAQKTKVTSFYLVINFFEVSWYFQQKFGKEEEEVRRRKEQKRVSRQQRPKEAMRDSLCGGRCRVVPYIVKLQATYLIFCQIRFFVILQKLCYSQCRDYF